MLQKQKNKKNKKKSKYQKDTKQKRKEILFKTKRKKEKRKMIKNYSNDENKPNQILKNQILMKKKELNKKLNKEIVPNKSGVKRKEIDSEEKNGKMIDLMDY